MKRYLIGFFLLAISIIPISSANATEYDWYIEHNYDYFKENIMTSDYETKLNDVISKIETFISEQEIPDDWKYYITLSQDNSDNIKMNVVVLNLTEEQDRTIFEKARWTASYYRNDNYDYVYVHNGLTFDYSTLGSYRHESYSVYLDEYTIGDYEINSSMPFYNFAGNYHYFDVGRYDFASSIDLSKIFNKNQFTRASWTMLYASNFDMIYSDTAHIERDNRVGYKINGVELEEGDVVTSYRDYSGVKEFHEIVNTNNYSEIDFIFEIPLSTTICTKEVYDDIINDPENSEVPDSSLDSNLDYDTTPTIVEYPCPTLDLDYDIFTSDVNGNIDTLAMAIPYLIKSYNYDDTENQVTYVIKDNLPLSNASTNQYKGTYTIDYDSNIIALKLVIPLDYIPYTYVNVNLSSNIPFKVSYKERESGNMEYVDITGKYGVALIPKQIDEDVMTGFIFTDTGAFGIQVRDSQDSENYKVLSYRIVGYCNEMNFKTDIDTDICVDGNNQYQVYFNLLKGNLYQSVFIVNRNYPNDDVSIVGYDSRYFMPVVYDVTTSTPTYTHPITGEEITLPSIENFDEYYMKEQNDNFYKTFLSAMNRFKNTIIEIFQNVTYFFNNMNGTLQDFFIVIFVFILFAFLIRFIL